MTQPVGLLDKVRSLARQISERSAIALIAMGERIVPNRNGIVVRTATDFDDQGREITRALADLGRQDVTWLVNVRSDGAASRPDDGATCPILAARSRRGIVAYWRARVVVHTHGVFGSHRASRGKRFVNLWHGMPIKKLPTDSEVARHQTDLTIATSSLHARNLADTWNLPLERVAIVGLPRNDVLIRPVPDEHRRLVDELTGGRPLVVWLPTFRSLAGTGDAVDGIDVGMTSQLPGGTPDAINRAMERLGLHAILKTHPLAPQPTQRSLSHLDIWSDQDLGAADFTLYELLAAADYLVTDQSSVWVDFLVTGRPIVFALSDLDEYAASRGFYFDSLESLLPGPLVEDLDGLETELRAFTSGSDRWTEDRRAALELHHANVDAHAAERVARLILEDLDAH